MAFATCVGIVIFDVVTLFTHPTLPLSAGERIDDEECFPVAPSGLYNRSTLVEPGETNEEGVRVGTRVFARQ
jgi:hypothetical protein